MGVPVAAALKVAFSPVFTTTDCGWLVIVGLERTRSEAGALVTEPELLRTYSEYSAWCAGPTFESTRDGVIMPAISSPLERHW